MARNTKNKSKKRVTRSASNAAADEESTGSGTGSTTSTESHEVGVPGTAEPKDASPPVDAGDVKCDTGSAVSAPPAPAKEEAEVDQQDDPNASVGGVQVTSVDATQAPNVGAVLAQMQQLTALVSNLGLYNVQMSERMASLEASRNASQELPRQSEGQLPPRPSPNDDGGDGSSDVSGTGPSGNGGDGGHPSRHQGPPDGGGDGGGNGIFCDDNVRARAGRVLFGQDSKTLSPAQIKEFKSLKSLDSRIPLTDALRECTRLVIKALVESDGKSFHSQIGILTALCSVGCNLGTNVASQHVTSAMLSDLLKSTHPIWQQSSAPGYSEVAVSDSGPGDDLSLLDDDGTSGGSEGDSTHSSAPLQRLGTNVPHSEVSANKSNAVSLIGFASLEVLEAHSASLEVDFKVTEDGRVTATLSFPLSILIAQRQVIQSRAAWAMLQSLQELLKRPVDDAPVKFITPYTRRRLQYLLDATAASETSIATHPRDPASDRRAPRYDLACGNSFIAALATLAHDNNTGLSAAVNVLGDLRQACKDPSKGDMELQIARFLAIKKDVKPGQSAQEFEASVRRHAQLVNSSNLPYDLPPETLGYAIAPDGSGNLAMTSEPALSISIGMTIFRKFQYEQAFSLCFVDGNDVFIDPAKDPSSILKMTQSTLDRFDANQQSRSVAFRAKEKPKKPSGGSGGKGGGSVSGSGGQNAAQQGHSFGAVVDSSKGGHGRGRSQSSERSGRGRGMLDMPVYSSCLLQLMEDGVKAYSLTDPIVAFDAAVSKCYADAISSMSAEGRSRFVLEDPRQRTVSAPNGPVLKTLMVEGAGVFDDELRLNGNASFSRLMAIKDVCGFSRKNSAYNSAKSKCGNSADYCLSWWYTTSELAKYLNDQFGKFLRGRESGKAPGGPGKGKGKGSGKGGQSRGRSRHRRSGGNGGGSSGATAMVSFLDSNPAGSDGDGKQTTNADGTLDP